MVGLAVLSLFADVAEKQPLVCVIDDAQWLDVTSAQTLAFVARRLMAEPVGLVIAVRGVREDRVFVGQPTMQVRGLTDGDARALLDSVLPGDVDSRVRETIVAEARGNPLALLELPRGLSAAELTFGYGLADTVPLETRLEQGLLATPGRASPSDAPVLADGCSGARRGHGPVATCRSATRCRLLGRGACGAGRPDRGRRLGPVPTPTGTVRRCSGRGAARPASRAPHACRGDRSGARSRPPGMAPGARSQRSRRGRRPRIGAVRGSGAGQRGPVGTGGLSRTCHRADPGPCPASGQDSGRRAGPAPGRLGGRGAGPARGDRGDARWTSRLAPRWRYSGLRSRSSPETAATRPAFSSRRPGAWKPRARRRPATSISTRWRRVCSSECSPTRSVSARSRPPPEQHPHRAIEPPISCWTACRCS